MLGIEVMCEHDDEVMEPMVAADGFHWECPVCGLEVRADLVKEAKKAQKFDKDPQYVGYNPDSWDPDPDPEPSVT